MTDSPLAVPGHAPHFPPGAERHGIGIVGFGSVARRWHLTAYRKHGLRVAGVYDVDSDARSKAAALGLRVFPSLDALLTSSEVDVVDVATRPVGRTQILLRCIAAGKHVLAQKPLAVTLREARAVAHAAARAGVRVAVNQNGRWAPPWRAATLLVRADAVGEVQAVTHLYDVRMTWRPRPEVHGTRHFLLFDYSVHWIDITRAWLGRRPLEAVQARDHDHDCYATAGDISQTAWVALRFAGGADAVIRAVACAHAYTGHPFWIHGTEGTLRGGVDCPAGDWLVLEKDGAERPVALEGSWFPDGFAGAMGELLCALEEGRPPEHTVDDALVSFQATLAACRSADAGGRVMRLPGRAGAL
jgi:predicted dehydrogenase